MKKLCPMREREKKKIQNWQFSIFSTNMQEKQGNFFPKKLINPMEFAYFLDKKLRCVLEIIFCFFVPFFPLGREKRPQKVSASGEEAMFCQRCHHNFHGIS